MKASMSSNNNILYRRFMISTGYYEHKVQRYNDESPLVCEVVRDLNKYNDENINGW